MNNPVMKAYVVRDKNDSWCATVVFAETRGKAKSRAQATETCEDVDFIDIECRRAPELDKHYRPGKTEMHWDCMEDRVALVKELGFRCGPEDIYYLGIDCKECAAAPWCDLYQDRLAEQQHS